MKDDDTNNGNMPKNFGDWGAEYGWNLDPTDVNNANFPRDLGGWGRTKGETNNSNLPADLASGEMTQEEKDDIGNHGLPKTLTFADFMVVDYTPGMGDYISYQAQKRKRGHYDTFGDSYEPEGEELNEALSHAQRLKAAIRMRKMSKRIAIARKRALRRTPTTQQFKKRAERQARRTMFKKLSKGVAKTDMPLAQRQALEKRLKKMGPRLKRLATKLLPKVRQTDRDRKKGKSNPDQGKTRG